MLDGLSDAVVDNALVRNPLFPVPHQIREAHFDDRNVLDSAVRVEDRNRGVGREAPPPSPRCPRELVTAAQVPVRVGRLQQRRELLDRRLGDAKTELQNPV